MDLSRTHAFKLTAGELQALKRAHKRTRSKTKSYRLNTLVLLGQGWTYKAVAQALLIDVSAMRDYVRTYRDGGIRALLSDDYKGYEGKLSNEELVILEEYVEENTFRRVNEIIEYASHEFDVEFTKSGMTNLLHRLGFSYKKPRKMPGKADAKEQKKFVKNYRKLRKNMGKNDVLLFADGVHPQHNPLVMAGWIKKGKDKKIFTNTRYHRLNLLGAINIDTFDMVSQFSNTLNEEASLDLLTKIRKKYPTQRINLVLDNAGYFTSTRFKLFAAANAIELIFLPPYSPNLNLVERVWLYFQKNILYNKYYPTFDLFKLACKSFFRNFSRHRAAMTSLLTEKFEILSST